MFDVKIKQYKLDEFAKTEEDLYVSKQLANYGCLFISLLNISNTLFQPTDIFDAYRECVEEKLIAKNCWVYDREKIIDKFGGAFGVISKYTTSISDVSHFVSVRCNVVDEEKKKLVFKDESELDSDDRAKRKLLCGFWVYPKGWSVA